MASIKDAVRHLILSGADIDAKTRIGSTALHLAAEAGNLEMVEMLFERGADIDARDLEGKTPLQKADPSQVEDMVVRKHREGVVKFLKKQKKRHKISWRFWK